MTFIKMIKDDSGASAAEYALILAIIGAVGVKPAIGREMPAEFVLEAVW